MTDVRMYVRKREVLRLLKPLSARHRFKSLPRSKRDVRKDQQEVEVKAHAFHTFWESISIGALRAPWTAVWGRERELGDLGRKWVCERQT